MSKQKNKTARPRRRWTLHHYHRYLGLASALLLVLLAITGIALNHTEGLRLDERKINSRWLLNWYGIPEPQLQTAFQLNGHWLAQWDGAVYWQSQKLEGFSGRLQSAVSNSEFIVLSSKETIALYTLEGEWVDALPPPRTDLTITALGTLKQQQIVADSSAGIFQLNDDLTAFDIAKEDDLNDLQWHRSSTLPEAEKQAFLSRYKGDGLPLERIMLDLHSGRILGPFGVYLMDLMALFLIALAVSGVYTWGKRKRRQFR